MTAANRRGRKAAGNHEASHETGQLPIPYAAIIQASPLAIFDLLPDGRVRSVWNPAAERMFGWSAEEVIGRYLPIVPDEKRHEFDALRARVFGGESLTGVEVRRRRKDGSPISIRIWTAPLHDASGSINGSMAMVADVTQQKETEQALATSDSRYRRLVESARDVILSVSADGRITSLNPAFEALTGWPVAEWVGKPFGPLVHSDDLSKVLATFARALEGQSVSGFEARVLTKSGKHLVAEVTATPQVVEGDVVEILGIARDVTARVESQAQLRLQATALEAAASAIVITDPRGTIVWTNPAFTEITGYSTEEAIGRTPAMLKSGRHDRAFYQELWNTILAGRVWRGEVTNRRKDGRLYVEEQTITPVRNDRGEIIHFIAVKQDVTVRKQATEQVERQLQDIQALHNIDLAIASSLDLQLTLRIILDQVTARLRVDAADVLLLDAATQVLTVAADRGFSTPAPQRARVRMGEGWAGKAALDRRSVWVPSLARDPAAVPVPAWVTAEGFEVYCAVPLVAKGDVKGVLEVFHRAPLPAEERWMEFLGVLATQVALAIDNITTFESLQKANAELQVAYDATLEGWTRALDLRHKETEGHTRRVTDLAIRLARTLGVGDRDLIHIRRGALLHDIGKIAIPDSILLKPGTLTPEEWGIMRRHPSHAYELLHPVPHLRPALDIPYCHHERWDGTGYPRGLRADKIPLVARIFAVVDVWDALLSDRSYRSAWTKERVREYLREQAGKQFDPAIVQAFLEMEL